MIRLPFGGRGVLRAAAFLLALPLLAQAPAAKAAEDCLLVVEAKSGRVVAKQGLCATRHAPCSTFKVALGLMGFDTGILKGPDAPVFTPDMAPDKDVVRWREGWDQPVTPASWMRDSVVWYSQVLTSKLGMERFSHYVHALAYGNENVSGFPGKDDGLIRAWLSSSLRISPREQIDFLRRMVNGDLPVSREAVAATLALMAQKEEPEGWRLHGKTGACFLPKADGAADKERPIGWFVGAAEKDEHTLVFTRFIALDHASQEPLGFVARRQALAALATILKAESR